MNLYTVVPATKIIDDRGYLCISNTDFCIKQINISHSNKGVLRGLHYQYNRPLTKIISVLEGQIRFFALDIKNGRREEAILEKGVYINVPPNIACGFHALTETRIQYLYDEIYNPNGEGTISPFHLGFYIPLYSYTQSDRDKHAVSFENWRSV
jgi:dTDP-4-dehydrorhamnose 3,5-epimerase